MKLAEKREEKLKAAIKEMGSGKNKIAAFLKSKKIKGVPCSWNHCPLANYFGKIFGKKCEYVEVGGENIDIVFTDQPDVLSLPASKAMNAFIEDFDEGRYPFLDETIDDKD
jgi:ribosomal protein L25 (general stress protein Ctc)